jgi:hypothetical protein
VRTDSATARTGRASARGTDPGATVGVYSGVAAWNTSADEWSSALPRV